MSASNDVLQCPVNLEVLSYEIERLLEILKEVDIGIDHWPPHLLADVDTAEHPDPLYSLVGEERERRLSAGETQEEIARSGTLVTKEIAAKTIPEYNPSAARLLLARARYNAEFACHELKQEAFVEAVRFRDKAQEDLTGALLLLVRPEDFKNACTPPKDRGAPPKGTDLDLRLFMAAKELKDKNPGWNRSKAARNAIREEPALKEQYEGKTDKALVSAYRRGQQAYKKRNMDQ